MIRRLAAIVAVALITVACSAGSAPEPHKPSPPMSRPVAQEGGTCSGFAGIQCGGGLNCQFDPGVCTRIADATGTCRKPPQACTREYRPVCGCDGKTYGNACTAAAAGVSVSADGECRA